MVWRGAVLAAVVGLLALAPRLSAEQAIVHDIDWAVKQAVNNTLIVIPTNAGFVEMTLNSYCNLKRHVPPDSAAILAVAFDKDAAIALKGMPVYLDTSLDMNMERNVTIFNTHSYTKIVLTKLTAVRNLIKRGVRVILWDGDIGTHSNPLAGMFDRNDIDMAFSYDGRWATSRIASQERGYSWKLKQGLGYGWRVPSCERNITIGPCVVNSGLYVAYPTKATLRFFDIGIKMSLRLGRKTPADQIIVQNVINGFVAPGKAPANIGCLNPCKWTNGALQQSYEARRSGIKTVTIHANYNMFPAKVPFLKDKGLWEEKCISHMKKGKTLTIEDANSFWPGEVPGRHSTAPRPYPVTTTASRYAKSVGKMLHGDPMLLVIANDGEPEEALRTYCSLARPGITKLPILMGAHHPNTANRFLSCRAPFFYASTADDPYPSNPVRMILRLLDEGVAVVVVWAGTGVRRELKIPEAELANVDIAFAWGNGGEPGEPKLKEGELWRPGPEGDWIHRPGCGNLTVGFNSADPSLMIVRPTEGAKTLFYSLGNHQSRAKLTKVIQKRLKLDGLSWRTPQYKMGILDPCLWAGKLRRPWSSGTITSFGPEAAKAKDGDAKMWEQKCQAKFGVRAGK